MQRTDFAAFACSIARTLHVVGDAWSLLILRDLFAGIDRFDALQRNLGVASNVLTSRLKTLLAHGLLTREADAADARVARYRLTPKGAALLPALAALMQWGDRWAASDEGPPMRLHHRRCGRQVHAGLRCAHCAVEVDAAALELRPGPGGRSGPGTEVLAELMADSVAAARRAKAAARRAGRGG